METCKKCGGDGLLRIQHKEGDPTVVDEPCDECELGAAFKNVRVVVADAYRQGVEDALTALRYTGCVEHSDEIRNVKALLDKKA